MFVGYQSLFDYFNVFELKSCLIKTQQEDGKMKSSKSLLSPSQECSEASLQMSAETMASSSTTFCPEIIGKSAGEMVVTLCHEYNVSEER